MKYIRTKSGIYEVAKIIQDCDKGDIYVVNLPKSQWDYDEDNKLFYKDSMTDSFWKHEIIKQADTIEDLCDRFIVEYENGSFTIFNDFKNLKRHFDYYPQYYHKVTGRYGVIFIKDRGLIYVAKMNNKGELELL